ncbi:IST1-like protein, partial [Mucuna pruriens]
MLSDIAKLLEAGQEVKAGVKVEHVIREENMMDAQDIIQLFCEHFVARLPMIQSQNEAISSGYFAAPRGADLPELLQVQLLFDSKYGKDFVYIAIGLTPHCSVNSQVSKGFRFPISQPKDL